MTGLSKPVLCIVLHDGHTVGLTAIDGDPLRSAMTGQRFAQKALRGL